MADDDLIGRVIDGRYRIEVQIGSGAMGVVYRARHVRLDKDVAIKVLGREPGKSDALVRRFLKEARLASSLEHPNVVDLSDCGELAWGGAYYVMELLSGETLAQTLQRRRRVSPEEAFAIVEQIVEGLVAAHAREIVHRDLKPENVFLCRTAEEPPQIKLLDFGIARAKGSTDTLPGMVLGTPEYMAPEQALGDTVDPRADLYALGVMLFELLTGRVPLYAKGMGEMLRLKLQGKPTPLTQASPELARMHQTEALIDGLLARDPDHRIQTIGEVKTKLLAAKAADLAAEPPKPKLPPSKSGRRRTQDIGSGDIGEPEGPDTDFTNAVKGGWRRPKTAPSPHAVKGKTVPATDDRRVVVPGEVLHHDPMASRRVPRPPASSASVTVVPVEMASGAVAPMPVPMVVPAPPATKSIAPVLVGVAALLGAAVAAVVVIVGVPGLENDASAEPVVEAPKQERDEVEAAAVPEPVEPAEPAEPVEPAEPNALVEAIEPVVESVAEPVVESVEPPMEPEPEPAADERPRTEERREPRPTKPKPSTAASDEPPTDEPTVEPPESTPTEPDPAPESDGSNDGPLDLVSPW